MCLPCENVCMYVDNQGAIALAYNPVHHKRLKHIDVKYRYVRLEIQNVLTSRKNLYPPHGRSLEIPKGMGDLKSENFRNKV